MDKKVYLVECPQLDELNEALDEINSKLDDESEEENG
jgi:hypothetical protein